MDDKIQALEQELEMVKKQAKEVETTRKTAEEQVKKMREDFDGYHRWKNDEWKIMADASKVANIHKELIQSVGEETEMPRDVLVVDFMEWLAVNGH